MVRQVTKKLTEEPTIEFKPLLPNSKTKVRPGPKKKLSTKEMREYIKLEESSGASPLRQKKGEVHSVTEDTEVTRPSEFANEM
jgi:hypothetical protein